LAFLGGPVFHPGSFGPAPTQLLEHLYNQANPSPPQQIEHLYRQNHPLPSQQIHNAFGGPMFHPQPGGGGLGIEHIIHALLGGNPGIHGFGPGETVPGTLPSTLPTGLPAGGAGSGITMGLQPFPDGQLLRNVPGPPSIGPGSVDAHDLLAEGNPTGAAKLWEARHPYAMAHGGEPHWVIRALLQAIQNAQPQPPAPAPLPTAAHPATAI
jgi:hypothetical protein